MSDTYTTDEMRERAIWWRQEDMKMTASMLDQAAAEIDRLRGVLAVKDHALNIAWGRIKTIDAQKLEVVANNDDVISIINAALADGEGAGK